MHDLAKVVPRFWRFVLPHFNDILWKSLEIFGDVRKSLELLTHHLQCQVFFVGSQQDLLIPCLCNLAKIWICVILVRWCQDLALSTATFGILWKSLGIFGDVRSHWNFFSTIRNARFFLANPRNQETEITRI